MKLYKQKAGSISEHKLWVIWDAPYLYEADTLLGVLWKLITEWKHDKHIIM